MKKTYLFITLLFIFSLLPLNTSSAQSVDILWQGETYTPPFYEGKSLWSSQSQITFVAIPQGFSNPSNLNYKWTRSGTVLGNTNGIGQNSITFMDSILSRPQTIDVEIISSDGKILARDSVDVAPVAPIAVVYENHPLYGFMFNNQIRSGYQLQSQEITLTAFPLFFTASDHNDPNVNFIWKTNAGDVGDRSSVTYRIPEDTSGSSNVSVTATHLQKLLQSFDRSFIVQFGN